MTWLRSLFPRREEAAAAPPVPTPEPVAAPYKALTHTNVITFTCAGCGAVYRAEGYASRPAGWARTWGFKEPIAACPACADILKKAQAEQNLAASAASQRWFDARRPALQNLRRWESENPRPALRHYPSREVFARRTVCGRCGTVEEVEAPFHAMPKRPAGWMREGDTVDGRHFGGAIVCPKCHDELAPLRAELNAWQKRKDEAVGPMFRDVPDYPTNIPLVLPDSWRK